MASSSPSSPLLLCKIKLKLVVQTGCLHSLLRFTFPPFCFYLCYYCITLVLCFLASWFQIVLFFQNYYDANHTSSSNSCCLLKYGITKHMSELYFTKVFEIQIWLDVFSHIWSFHCVLIGFVNSDFSKKIFSDIFQAFLLAFLMQNDSQYVRLCDVQ